MCKFLTDRKISEKYTLKSISTNKMKKKTYCRYARAKYILMHKVDNALVVPSGDNLMPLNGG